MAANPLEQYFRKPAIYIELPSKGNFYKNKPKLSADNELAVFGMTAKDELVLKNPDALLNGEGVITVLESVTPDVINPREIPIPDFNSILIAMRIASYGKDMEYVITCTECNHIDTVTFDLYEILANSESLESEYIVDMEPGIKVYIGPTNVDTQNKVSLGSLEQSRLLDVLSNEDESEEKMKKFSKIFEKLTSITFDIVQDGILYVKLPDDTVVENNKHINEWLNNITKADYELISKKVAEVNKIGVKTDFIHICSECKTELTNDLQFDPASFFV